MLYGKVPSHNFIGSRFKYQNIQQVEKCKAQRQKHYKDKEKDILPCFYFFMPSYLKCKILISKRIAYSTHILPFDHLLSEECCCILGWFFFSVYYIKDSLSYLKIILNTYILCETKMGICEIMFN